ncbi:hypothetical protein R3P38DRAFT_3042945 [Favolaschia claudopus]|uniref:Uncharacterized protein n=1 Tax=Favolaschia claudopus TaxID=2862362 RepID=A0AAW0A976_9AGAR
MSGVSLPADFAPYRPITTEHEAKFASFLEFLQQSQLARTTARDASEYAIQLVSQVNFGPPISKQYFATAALLPPSEPTVSGDIQADAPRFVEVTEQQMIEMNLKKANAYKNYKSVKENRFYEMNLYLRDTTSAYHWRANIARPSAQIDL